MRNVVPTAVAVIAEVVYWPLARSVAFSFKKAYRTIQIKAIEEAVAAPPNPRDSGATGSKTFV
jgi:hypothetical protein